jgi:hypothetical protein
LVSFHFDQYLIELERVENALLEKRELYQQNILKIFEIGGGTQTIGEECDLEGDNDILNLSFRGERVDIRRSNFTKSKLPWNFFSCLFTKKWDTFHIRDKEGRIYLDWNYDGFRPLINYVMINCDTAKSFSGHLVYESVRCLEMNSLLANSQDLTGLHVSKIILEDSHISRLRLIMSSCLLGVQSFHFSLLDSFDFRNPIDGTRAISPNDLRYKCVCILIQPIEGGPLGIISDLHSYPNVLQTTANSMTFFFLEGAGCRASECSLLEMPNSTSVAADLADIFPLRIVNRGNDNVQQRIFLEIQRNGKGVICHNFMTSRYDVNRLEIFEIQRNDSLKFRSPHSCNEEPSEALVHSATGSEWYDHGNIVPFPVKFQEAMNLPFQHYQQELARMEQELYNQRIEISFLTKYFYLQICSDEERRFTEHELIDEGLPLCECFELLQSILQTRVLTSELSPIISFRVEDKVISILRSTLLRIIPGSLLANKLTGRWTI